MLSSGESELELHQRMFEIDLGGDDGISLPFHHCAKAVYLLLIQKQDAIPSAFEIKITALFIRGDIEIFEKGRASVDGYEAIGKAHFARANALHLASHEDHARFIGLVYEVIVICFFILRYDFYMLHTQKKRGR